MSSSISSTTLKSWRERSPSSYSLKFQNFSQLKKSTVSSDNQYQSGLFSSGGYNWRMIIYPKGNDKDNGSGFISMYVEIDNTSLMSTPPSEVFVDLRFLIYNKKENKYFTIQDVESKQFNTVRTIWGLPQVFQLDTFNDPKNGYIFGGDECEFGVDVIVAPPPTKWETVSFDEEPYYPKFSWTVKNFFELKEDLHLSESFSMGERNWVLELYPKGYPRGDGKWLFIYQRFRFYFFSGVLHSCGPSPYDVFFRAKQTREQISDSSNKTKECFELIHVDVWGHIVFPILAEHLLFLLSWTISHDEYGFISYLRNLKFAKFCKFFAFIRKNSLEKMLGSLEAIMEPSSVAYNRFLNNTESYIRLHV